MEKLIKILIFWQMIMVPGDNIKLCQLRSSLLRRVDKHFS